MKRTKLIANLCLLVLTIACLTFGVYSAVKTSFTAIGTITFNAYGINLDIDMSFAGTGTVIGNKYVSTHTGRSEHLTSGQPYTDISAGVTGLDLTFDELTIPEGKTEPELKITMTLNVKNYSGFPIAATPTLKLGASGSETVENFDSKFTSSVSNGVVGLAEQGTAAITITISPKKPATAITSNNNFKFEFEFVPYNYNSYYTSQGYTLLENDGITISSGALSGQYTGTATKIIIPEGVTSIGDSAFKGCSSLTSIAIPSSVTSIGGNVFSSCGSLASITIEGATTDNWAWGAASDVTYESGTKIDLTDAVNNVRIFTEYRYDSYFVKNV